MAGAIALIATLDTKGPEVKYLKDRIEEKGGAVRIVDTGMRGTPQAVRADVSREEVAARGRWRGPGRKGTGWCP